jgi:hypothetical protein
MACSYLAGHREKEENKENRDSGYLNRMLYIHEDKTIVLGMACYEFTAVAMHQKDC